MRMAESLMGNGVVDVRTRTHEGGMRGCVIRQI